MDRSWDPINFCNQPMCALAHKIRAGVLPAEDGVATLNWVGYPASVGDGTLGPEEALLGGHSVHSTCLDGALVGFALCSA